jgi:hypothetical protein
MQIKRHFRGFVNYLKKDTWDSWLVSILLIVLFIKLIFFPSLSLLTGSSLPLVFVESCSMYHESSFDSWWEQNEAWYKTQDISKSDFDSFPSKNGLNKGDLIMVIEKKEYKQGDIIVFQPNPESRAPLPIIHRIVSLNPIATKGDHNTQQFSLAMSESQNPFRIDETNIPKDRVIGKAVKIAPWIGWIKLIWTEPFRSESQKGLCK